MSEAPRLSASTSSTFDSLITGAASDDLDRAPRSISSSPCWTVSTSASSLASESMSTSERPTAAMSSKESEGPSSISFNEGASPNLRPPPDMEPDPMESLFSCSERVDP